MGLDPALKRLLQVFFCIWYGILFTMLASQITVASVTKYSRPKIKTLAAYKNRTPSTTLSLILQPQLLYNMGRHRCRVFIDCPGH